MSSDEEHEEFVKVSDDPDSDPVELPVESDETLLLTTLQGQFPNAVGLRYQSSSGSWRGVRIVDDALKPPAGGWGYETVYQVTSASGLKRKPAESDDEGKGENEKKTKIEEPDTPPKKPSREEKKYLSDVILLGLPPECKGKDLKEYFTAACGELAMYEVKTKAGKEGTRSRGFGFVRFKTVEGTKAALNGEHSIMGKTIKIKLSVKKEEPMKLFVGRIPEEVTREEIKEYFEEFGDVREVYLPQPRRGFGFVTYRYAVDGYAALKKSHKLNGTKINVDHAEEKEERLPPRRDDSRHNNIREERKDHDRDFNRRDRRDYDNHGTSRHENRGDSRRSFRDDRGYRSQHNNQRSSYGRNEPNQSDQLKNLLFSILGNN